METAHTERNDELMLLPAHRITMHATPSSKFMLAGHTVHLPDTDTQIRMPCVNYMLKKARRRAGPKATMF